MNAIYEDLQGRSYPTSFTKRVAHPAVLIARSPTNAAQLADCNRYL